MAEADEPLERAGTVRVPGSVVDRSDRCCDEHIVIDARDEIPLYLFTNIKEPHPCSSMPTMRYHYS